MWDVDAYRRGDSEWERDRFRERPPITGIRDAMRRAIISLPVGVELCAAAEGPAFPCARTAKIRPSRGPSNASFAGGSCLETSLEAYETFTTLNYMQR